MNFAAETSLGVVTVRAFNMTEIFFRNYLKLVDTDAAQKGHIIIVSLSHPMKSLT